MNVTMVSRATLIGVGLALLAACGGAPRDTVELVEGALAGSVAIEAERGAAFSVRENPLSGAAELVPQPAATVDYGAGVILEDGQILTNAHLVDGAARVQVRPAGADGPPLPATVIGVSLCDDLALLRVDDAGLRPARLGASADLRLGAPVVALGFAPGGAPASPTVSEGIVSRLGLAPGGLPAASLFSVSAPLQPGGSGGPLLNPAGEVVGMLTEGRFAAPAAGADYGIGIDYARQVAEQLASEGSVLSLGLDLVEFGARPDDPSAAPFLRYFGLEPGAGGLFVRSIAPEALTTGVQAGDLLVAAAGRPVSSLSDLCGALGDPNTALPADLEVVRRNGEAVERVRAALLGIASTPPLARATAAQPRQTGAAASLQNALEPAAAQAEAPPAAPAVRAPVAAVGELSPEELQAAREALAAERAGHQELFFETFDSEATKGRWRPSDDAAARRELIYSYYRLILKQPGALTSDSWGDRPLGPRYIAELEVALPPSGSPAVGLVYDQQTDGSGLSYFVLAADGSWQTATFQGGALVAGRYARGASPLFSTGGGTNFLRVVRLPDGVQFWLNDTLVARADPGPFNGGHVGVIAIAGPEALPEPVTVIVDNFRLLEHP